MTDTKRYEVSIHVADAQGNVAQKHREYTTGEPSTGAVAEQLVGILKSTLGGNLTDVADPDAGA